MGMTISEMLFVVGLGFGTVFVGLIAIIILCKIVSFFCKGTNKNTTTKQSVSVPTVIPQKIENRQEIIAAVTAAIAEELGTDIKALRVLSFKKI